VPERFTPPDDLSGMAMERIAALAAARPAAPVERWDPPFCGHSGIVIAGDGTWQHDGRPIGRAEMVRLFASVLRREADGSFALVTPAERLAITVADTPFVVVQLASEGSGPARRLAARLSTGDVVLVGPDHPLRIEGTEEQPRPLLLVRPGLDARLARGAWLDLVALALDEGDGLGIWSGGRRFSLEISA
jgi:uncharacterized protein